MPVKIIRKARVAVNCIMMQVDKECEPCNKWKGITVARSSCDRSMLKQMLPNLENYCPDCGVVMKTTRVAFNSWGR